MYKKTAIAATIAATTTFDADRRRLRRDRY